MTDKGWARRFFEPIDVPGGRPLATLRDAGEYIASLPAKTAKLDHWQTATAEMLTSAEQGGIIMLAEIAMRRAINHGREPPAKEEPRRKAVKRYRIVR